MRLGPVGVEGFGCQHFGQRGGERRLLAGVQAGFARARQGACRVDADGASRVGKARAEQARTRGGLQRRQSLHGRQAHVVVGIVEGCCQCGQRCGRQMRSQALHGTGACDGALRAIGHHGQQAIGRARHARIGGEEGLCKALIARLGLQVPAPHRVGRPTRRAFGVAAIAGVGRAQGNAAIGARNAQAVVVARVHAHVGGGGHVAGRALRTGAVGRVVVVLRCVEAATLVATHAHRVAGGAQLAAVRLMAVTAGDACRVHAALQERRVVVDLVAHLPVHVVQPRLQQGGPEGIEQGVPGAVLVAELAAACMATGADFELLAPAAWRTARGGAGGCVGLPDHADALVQLRGQAKARQCGAALELAEARRELAALKSAPLPEVAERIRRELQPYLAHVPQRYEPGGPPLPQEAGADKKGQRIGTDKYARGPPF